MRTGREHAPPGRLEKATGKALFGADVSRPHQLWGAVVRSTRPHARILGIDAGPALALTGVAAVVTGAEVRRMVYYGVDLYDQRVLARDKVRWIGEPVALVAAETPELAASAAALVQVSYDSLPPVYGLDDALAPGAALVHEHLLEYEAGWPAIRHGNVCSESRIRYGDVDAALSQADRVFTHTFETQIIHQSYIEPHASLAEADASGKVTIWTTNQKPFAVRHYMSQALGKPMTKIRVIGLHIGGGFGGKLEMGLEPYCALLALKTRRPVKMVMSRAEEFVGANPRHASRYHPHHRRGPRHDHRLPTRRSAPRYRCILGQRAHGRRPGPVLLSGPYRADHQDLHGSCVYTNKASSGSCRGPGGPQAVFAGGIPHRHDRQGDGMGPAGIPPSQPRSRRRRRRRRPDARSGERPRMPGKGRGGDRLPANLKTTTRATASPAVGGPAADGPLPPNSSSTAMAR